MYMGNITEQFGIIRLVRTQKSSLTPDMTTTCVYQMEIGIYWDSLHARLNSHYKAWSYKKKKQKKIKTYKISL